MDRLNEDCLISIFNFLDLQSRLQASKTCKLWRELLQDSKPLDNICEVTVDGKYFSRDPLLSWFHHHLSGEPEEVLNWDALAAILTHIQIADQLNLSTKVARILLDRPPQPIWRHLSRFGKINYVWSDDLGDNANVECLESSPRTITSLSFIGRKPRFMILDMSDLDHLESLELKFSSNSPYGCLPRCRLPSTLRALAINWVPPDDPPPQDPNSDPDSADPLVAGFSRVFSAVTLEEIMGDWPLLNSWRIGGIILINEILNKFLLGLPNLERIHFHNVFFGHHIDSPDPEKLPIQWMKFEECTKDWNKFADYLIKASPVKTVVISLKDESDLKEVQKVYDLMPLIDSKKASLELTIKSTNQPRDLEDLLVPTELSRVLTKLELHSVHHSRLLQSIFISDQFEKLTEMKLRNCIELGDIDLAVVAEWCLNLEKLSFMPHPSLGMHVITDQCLKPFITFWNSRKSMRLSIECLKTDLAFGWFQGPPDQEKGVFEDGKRWMQFRNSVLAGKKAGGSVQAGIRMMIWEENGKKMVIRDYDKDIRKKLKIIVEDGGCRVKEV